MSKESTSDSLDLVMDNPLSQNPDSMWSRFFKNAELERVLDQDLSRLYPERGSYFQTSNCQGMLRRILLLWCLSHPEYGYKQGMHELLAPLLYVLHVDVERLSEVRKNHDDQFADKFDDFPLYEGNLIYNSQKNSKCTGDEKEIKKVSNSQASRPSELDPQTQTIISLSDSYGAEGELGAVMSEKFMEHDAYCMFDALMSGSGGSVSMVEFFSTCRSASGFLPVIEASAALYHLLSLVDPSLHSHLVELGVEPQYFALRWLRVLFGREFSLENLLVIWDRIFSCDNTKSLKAPDIDRESGCGVLDSSRGAFISAFAVSMILYLRSSLLATENGTACLQRLLNFPDDANIAKLIGKAKSLQALAVDANRSSSFVNILSGSSGEKNSVVTREHAHSHSLDLSSSSGTVSHVVPDCYWEEQWRNLHKEEDAKGGSVERVSNSRRGWSEKVRLRLSRTGSTPTPLKEGDKLKIEVLDIKRNLLQDLEEQQLGSEKDQEITSRSEDKSNHGHAEINEGGSHDQKTSNIWNDTVCEEIPSSLLGYPSPVHENAVEVNHQRDDDTAAHRHNDMLNAAAAAHRHNDMLNAAAAAAAIFREESSGFSPVHENIKHEQESESVSVVSNSLTDDGGIDAYSCGSNSEFFSPPISHGGASKCEEIIDLSKRTFEKKILRSSKFQWLWKLGRNAGDGADARKVVPEDAKEACDSEKTVRSMEETVNQHSIVNLRSLGHSMHGYIQVIESFLQQNQYQTEHDLENATDELGKVLNALQELTNISNLLSEM